MEGRNIIYKIILFIATLFVVDMFYFPTTFSFFPVGNTKMYLAIIGLLIVGFGIKNRPVGIINRSLLLLPIFAAMISLASLFSITINQTPDYSYATYPVSMFVWLFAAYTVNTWIKTIYGSATIYRISDLIISVCVVQCIIALMVEYNPSIQYFVDGITDTVWLRSVDRMYGIGVSLDTAGIHFAVALVFIGYILGNQAEKMNNLRILLYILAIAIIVVVGNMIARTTSIGMLILIVYLIYKSGIFNTQISTSQKNVWNMLLIGMFMTIPIFVYFYIHNDIFYHNVHFAFEGFFSLVEKGKWDVSSTNTLKSMYIFPETIHTWLVGDGYFINPKVDPYYTGFITRGYYMNTDVGYLRFIFYFGLLGLTAFTAYMVYVSKISIAKCPQYKSLFLLLLLTNFIIWLKVATDLFFIFSILLLADQEDDSKEEAI